ncbi:MAG: hypothetical protein ABI377_05440 [Devosia sp.]
MPHLPRRELSRAFISVLVTLALMAALLFGAAGSLSWGHGWAFMIVFVLLLIRTSLEDTTLQREPPGYAEFAQKTRFKWIPGVW